MTDPIHSENEVLEAQLTETLAQVRIVLVNTTHAGNIGAAARAMKNMGMSKLYLVAPKDYPTEEGVRRAAGALDVLDNVVITDTLEEAVADCHLVVGTSARGRRIPWPLVTPRECGERAIVEAKAHPVAIVFGREDRGLTNDELQKCNYHVHIPTNPEYSSLNLAMAVQVLAYELRMACLSDVNGQLPSFDDWDLPPASSQAQEGYFAHLQETLEQLDFIQPGNPKQTMTRLRRLYSRVRLDEMELSILRGVLSATQKMVTFKSQKIGRLEARIEALESRSREE